MIIRGTLALDQVIAAAEQIEDPNPELLDVYYARLEAKEITPVEYLILDVALGLALLAMDEPE